MTGIELITKERTEQLGNREGENDAANRAPNDKDVSEYNDAQNHISQTYQL